VDFLIQLLPRLIAGIASIVDASNLRNRMYAQQEEHELMWTSLDDIARMHKDHPAGQHAARTLKNVNVRYGR
jgi:hypothetical protein